VDTFKHATGIYYFSAQVWDIPEEKCSIVSAISFPLRPHTDRY